MATNHEAGGSNPSNCNTSSRGLPILLFDRPMFRLRPIAVAVILTAFDAFWAFQALSAVPRNVSSTVSLASLIVWVVFHLPAAALASGLLKMMGALDQGAAGLSPAAFGLIAVLGLLETFLISWGVFTWLKKKGA